ncbi:MAG: glycine cleavage system aminomethyltransferase GcvT [Deltaproteobacteria bacterium]|nr:glycine cleavage system aminomethyltransferase GcvT [Deltaproteobacteria bacterium]
MKTLNKLYQHTPCYSWHVKAGARMVEFAGYLMPVSYSSLIEEHLNVRANAGLFDVSHMGEIFVEGREAKEFLQSVLVSDVDKLFPGLAIYTLFCNERGGIIDDLIVYCLKEQKYLICSNAATTEKDFSWLVKQKSRFDVELRNKSVEYAQFALQGPRAEEIFRLIANPALCAIKRFHFASGEIDDIPVIVCRTGYTGEDGFEIFLPSSSARTLWEKILSAGAEAKLMPIGLGARDTLRLEQGYLLYGQDMDEETTPFEAGIGWTVSLHKEFIGKEALKRQKEEGLKRNRVGFVMEGNEIARHDYAIVSTERKPIGRVTSGTFSPSLKKGIGMGYVPANSVKIGDEISIAIRSGFAKGRIVKMPFVIGSSSRQA